MRISWAGGGHGSPMKLILSFFLFFGPIYIGLHNMACHIDYMHGKYCLTELALEKKYYGGSPTKISPTHAERVL